MENGTMWAEIKEVTSDAIKSGIFRVFIILFLGTFVWVSVLVIQKTIGGIGEISNRLGSSAVEYVFDTSHKEILYPGTYNAKYYKNFY